VEIIGLIVSVIFGVRVKVGTGRMVVEGMAGDRGFISWVGSGFGLVEPQAVKVKTRMKTWQNQEKDFISIFETILYLCFGNTWLLN
jgi:hypothetical protein